MIELYERLSRRCKTINQINRAHIALESWMTPRQWHTLYGELLQSPRYGFLHAHPQEQPMNVGDIQHTQREWVRSLEGMYGKAPTSSPRKFERYRLWRHITWYKPRDGMTQDKILAVCFTGMAQRMMVPLPVFLQHVDDDKADVVLVRYPRGKGFRHGLEGVADNFEATLAAFSTILPIDQYRRAVAIGVSGGGLPAVLCALKLGFDAALSFSGGHPNDKRWHEALGYPGELLVRRLHQQARKNMPTYLVHGADAAADEAAASALAQMVAASVVKIGDRNKPVGHVSLYPLLMSRRLTRFLDSTVFAPLENRRTPAGPGQASQLARMAEG